MDAGPAQGGSPGTPPPTPPRHAPHLVGLAVLTPVSAAALGGHGGEQRGSARPLAIDDNPGTDWTTDSYQGSPRFGNLYGGTGLVLDMGQQVSVSSVAVTFGQVPGSRVRIEVGNEVGNNASGTVPAGAITLGRSSNAINTITFTGHHAATGRYVFIWFTSLAAQSGAPGHYQADVFNVVVRGSP